LPDEFTDKIVDGSDPAYAGSSRHGGHSAPTDISAVIAYGKTSVKTLTYCKEAL